MPEHVASVSVRADAHGSAVVRARQAGPMRVLCPVRPGPAWIVTGSLGGGLVDGDAVALEVNVDPGATCVVTTQASTKAYRGATRQRTMIRVAAGGAAIVVPDPIAPFRGARFQQHAAIELAEDASLVVVDAITAGRVAHGERWAAASIDTTLTIAVAGQSRLVDRIVLDEHAGRRMRRFDALATCVILGPRVRVQAAAALARGAGEPRNADIVVAGSALGDGAIVRIAGVPTDLVTATARAVVRDACAILGADPWSRRW